MTDRELMQQARDALTEYDGTNGESKRKRVLAALRDRLAQPEQEPVAWMSDYDVDFNKSSFGTYSCVPLYTAPLSVEAAVLAEREACAKVCDAEATIEGIAQKCAAAIRARG